MKIRLGFLLLTALMSLGCGSDTPPCFTPQSDADYIDRTAIFVANTGSNTISAFQEVYFAPGNTSGGVCGSPFAVGAPPTALGGGFLFEGGLLVASQPQKSVSLYPVNYLTSVLTGPLFTITTRYTPVAVAGLGGFFYVANAEGGISAYQVLFNGTAPTGAAEASGATELAGSPFAAGSGPVAIAAGGGPGLLYVANSQSNNVSGYSVDGSTGALTPLAGSPYAAGQGPASIVLAPAPGINPTGARLVMVANTLSNNVSVFSVAGDGGLSPVPGSPFAVDGVPSSVAVTTDGMPMHVAYVTIPALNEIMGFSIDAASGTLAPVAGSPFPAGQGPSAAAVSQGTDYLYVVNVGSSNLSVYSIDETSGALTSVTGSPFALGRSPGAIEYFQVPE
jgi:6-phosphogluconolactonase (cycloisomerase 2 family)